MQTLRATIVDIGMETSSVIHLSLKFVNNGQLLFKPGQYATITFPGYPKLRSNRPFSMVSSPAEQKVIRFGVKMFGRFTKGLRALKPGDSAIVAGPFGSFTFDENALGDLVLLAGGIGVTPFLSMVSYATDLQLPNRITMFYSSRTWGESAYRDELIDLNRRNPNFDLVFTITDDKRVPQHPSLIQGRITRELISQRLNGDLWTKTFFVCGPPPFMAAMKAALRSMGVLPAQIRTEGFGVVPERILGDSGMMKFIVGAWVTAAAAILFLVFKVDQARLKPQQQRYDPTLVQSIMMQAQQWSTEQFNQQQQQQQPATPTSQNLPPSQPSSPPSSTPATRPKPVVPMRPVAPRTTVS